MRQNKESWTARWVAWMRSLGEFLPDKERLVEDPFGERFSWPMVTKINAAMRKNKMLGWGAIRFLPLRFNVQSLQIRTRVIDDAIRDFAANGGKQVVILGAGFDARAARLKDLGLTFFEVDHPATQEKKKGVLTESERVFYVAWDFESDSLEQLPAALLDVGLRADLPTLTVWEGVTMYLTASTIDATVRAIRNYSSVGSRVVFNYFDAKWLTGVRGQLRLERYWVASLGEPFKFGWHPDELPGWMRGRGFCVIEDRDYRQIANQLVPSRAWRRGHVDRRIAVIEAV